MWALAVVSAYQFYSATIIGALAEEIWKELFRICHKRHPMRPGDALLNSKRPKQTAFDLLTPPSVTRIIVSNVLPALKYRQEESDEIRGLWLWFLYIVCPCGFFAWSVYILVKQGDNWSAGSVIVVVILCWRAVRTFWRVASSGIWREE